MELIKINQYLKAQQSQSHKCKLKISMCCNTSIKGNKFEYNITENKIIVDLLKVAYNLIKKRVLHSTNALPQKQSTCTDHNQKHFRLLLDFGTVKGMVSKKSSKQFVEKKKHLYHI